MKTITNNFERVAVVGCSCSGKSTFAHHLSNALRVPHIELDSLNWLPNWKERPLEDFRECVETALAGPRWVLDGNYTSRVGDLMWPRVTTIVWLNYSFPVVFVRSLRRTFHRVATGTPICGGNRESFRQVVMVKDSIPAWLVRSYKSVRQQYQRMFEEQELEGVKYYQCRNQKDLNAVLQSTEQINDRMQQLNRCAIRS